MRAWRRLRSRSADPRQRLFTRSPREKIEKQCLMPHTPLANWDFSIVGEVDQPKRWSWDEFYALPRETITKDIHCVTKWSKLDTHHDGE